MRKEKTKAKSWMDKTRRKLLEALEDPKAKIHINLLRASLKKSYQIGKHQDMTVCMDSGFKNSRLSTTVWLST